MNQILYIFDPLCGWCYGFSQTMLTFSKLHADKYEFVPIAGGMMTGSRVASYSNIAEFIKGSIPRLEVTTGTTFGDAYIENFLEDGSAVTNSEPPCRALIAFRGFLPGQAMEYAHRLQIAHYKEGLDYNNDSLYAQLAKSFDLDPKIFMESYSSQETRQNVEREFKWVKESGVKGFPTVIYQAEQKYYLISHGYVSLESLEASLEKANSLIP